MERDHRPYSVTRKNFSVPHVEVTENMRDGVFPKILWENILAIPYHLCYYTFKAYILFTVDEHFLFQIIRKSMLGIQRESN